MLVVEYRGYKIVATRNYGNTTVNAYTQTPPVEHIAAETIEQVKKLIDEGLTC